MKLQIISDLHLEFDKDNGEEFCKTLPVLSNMLVIAGDLIPLYHRFSHTVFGWLCSRFQYVIYVPGNHEYYGTSPSTADTILSKAEFLYSNLHVLRGDEVRHEGHQIIGATLWFPKTQDEHCYRQCLADFQYINNFVPWVHETHDKQMEYLRRNIEPGAIVITHHLPHPKSIPAQFKGSSTNRFFCADDAQEFFYNDKPPALWIHGHTHTVCDYVVGSTRVVCNPRGYPRENPGEYQQLVVDL